MIIFMMIISLSNSYAQEWPQWRGPGRDARVTGFKVPATWPAELKLEWKVNVGTGDASASLAGNKLYLSTRQGNDEVILCLDATSGKELWKTTYPAPAVSGPATSHPGPRSTPSVANGKVVTFGVSGILSCVDASTGKLLWRKEHTTNALPTFFTGTSPLVLDGVCIIHVGKTNDGQILALDLNTGNEKWKWAGDGPAYSTPALMTIDGKKHLIVQTEKSILALDMSDGKLVWKLDLAPVQRFYNASSPYVDDRTVYYTGQGTGIKALKVEKQGAQFVPTQLWNNTEVGAKWNTPVLKDGFLYGFTDSRKIYCVNASTGQTAWVDPTTNSDFSTIVDCGSVLIGLASTGNLIVFKPDPKAYSEVAKYKVAETPVYGFPIMAGTSIYIKDAETLMKYGL